MKRMHDYMGLIFEKMCKEYLIGSCKFKNKKIGMDELELLEHYAMVFAKGIKYYYVIFSMGGFTDELLSAAKERNVLLLTLDDIYNV